MNSPEDNKRLHPDPSEGERGREREPDENTVRENPLPDTEIDFDDRESAESE